MGVIFDILLIYGTNRKQNIMALRTDISQLAIEPTLKT